MCQTPLAVIGSSDRRRRVFARATAVIGLVRLVQLLILDRPADVSLMRCAVGELGARHSSRVHAEADEGGGPRLLGATVQTEA